MLNYHAEYIADVKRELVLLILIPAPAGVWPLLLYLPAGEMSWDSFETIDLNADQVQWMAHQESEFQVYKALTLRSLSAFSFHSEIADW